MKRKYAFVLVVIFVLLITYLHYSTLPRIYSLHSTYKEFYYIPIFMAAIAYGTRGSLLVYLMVLVFDMPFVLIGWTGVFTLEVVRLLHLILQGIFAVLAGLLADREKRMREQVEKDRYLAGLGQASAAIVHDLRNPLLTITGFAKRLQEHRTEPDAALREIMDAAQSMQEIIVDVLDFSKPPKLDLKRQDLREVVARACEHSQEKAKLEGVALKTSLPQTPQFVLLDAFQMERAIVNFINNSIEASRKGQEVMVFLKAGRTGPAILIRDRGVGMDKNTVSNLFVPFYTKKKGGTGLGMSIAKKVIDGHGGEIHIHSKPGAGTEVSVELPLQVPGEIRPPKKGRAGKPQRPQA